LVVTKKSSYWANKKELEGRVKWLKWEEFD
jgi:hypothetical protein